MCQFARFPYQEHMPLPPIEESLADPVRLSRENDLLRRELKLYKRTFPGWMFSPANVHHDEDILWNAESRSEYE